MTGKNILTVPAEINQLPAVISFVEEQLEGSGCSVKTSVQISVAVEELFVNIAHYAYPGKKGEATICITVDLEKRVLEIEFRDDGIPFDPLARPDPNTSLSAEARRIGGLGIFMAKKNLDEMVYTRENGQNILTVRKKI